MNNPTKPARRRIARVDRLTHQPAIGEWYRMPCIYVAGWNNWVPVLGPAHDDKAIIGFEAVHWHYDVRFLSDQQLDRATFGKEAEYALVAVVNAARVLRGPKLMVRQCRRLMPAFPLVSSYGFPSPFAGKLEDAFAHVRFKPDCLTCPHRGVPLNGLPDRDGVVVCPGHGLAWNVKTGEMVRRVKGGAL